jgi:hypothetical protein
MRYRTYIRWPRVRVRVGPVGVAVGATGATITACCAGCGGNCLMLIGLIVATLVFFGGERRNERDQH